MRPASFFKKNNAKIVSLGFDCEPSFKINFYCKKFDSYMFSWSYFCDRNCLPETILDMESTLLGKPLELFGHYRMVMFEPHLVAFHTKQITTSVSPILPEEISEVLSREKHLCSKTISLFNSGEPIVFLLKILGTNYFDDCHFVHSVDLALSQRVKGPYVLVPIFEKSHVNTRLYKHIVGDNITVRFVRRFWTLDARQSRRVFSGDSRGWLRILSSYTRGNRLRYAYTVSPLVHFLLRPFLLRN
jgi:hypothetical protein